MIERPRTLRGRILALVFLGAMLPLGLTGVWLARSIRSSGEEAVRVRLESELGSTARAIAYRWLEHRSALHRLAEHEGVRTAARGGGSADILRDGPVWRPLQGLVESVTIHPSNVTIALPALTPGDATSAMLPTSVLPVSIPIHASHLGEKIGTLEVRARLAYLLPASLWSGGGGVMVAVYDAAGEPLLSSSLDPRLLDSPRFEWNREEWIVAQRVLHEPPLRIAMAAPLGPLVEPLGRAAERGVVALLAVSLLAFIAATVVSGRLTRSLEALASASSAVSLGKLDAKAPEAGSVEVQRLGRAFNAMTESLRSLLRTLARQRSAEALGEFSVSLAHEIRNPLTAVRLDLEDVRDRHVDPVTEPILEHAIAQIDRLDATVKGTLQIAAGGAIELEPLDLTKSVRAAIHAARPRSEEIGVSVETDIPDERVVVHGNATAIEQLVLNLLLNAIEAAGRGGHVRVIAVQRNGRARVVVDDDGPGVPPALLGRVEEPFFTTKLDGTGLGLAVARRIADAHGGELRLEPREAGGTRAAFALPVHAP